jgi:hypothetical protein
MESGEQRGEIVGMDRRLPAPAPCRFRGEAGIVKPALIEGLGGAILGGGPSQRGDRVDEVSKLVGRVIHVDASLACKPPPDRGGLLIRRLLEPMLYRRKLATDGAWRLERLEHRLAGIKHLPAGPQRSFQLESPPRSLLSARRSSQGCGPRPLASAPLS